MSDTSKPFAFSQFVPGFDFLQNLASGAPSGGASAVPGMPSLSNWVAPTLSVEEVDKRIQELKTVQFWLEQNGHALKATIQALEVQKMTLSTLRGMNVRMEDLANAFTRQARGSPAAPRRASRRPPQPAKRAEGRAGRRRSRGRRHRPRAQAAAASPPAGVVDPLQWWGALTQQFQQIASSALQDASQLKMPAMAQPLADAVGKAMGTAGSRQDGAPRRRPPPRRRRRRRAKRAGAQAARAGALISEPHRESSHEAVSLRSRHPSAMAHGGRPRARAVARADGAAATTPARPRWACSTSPTTTRPTRRRSSTTSAPSCPRSPTGPAPSASASSANNAEYFDEPALSRDAVRAAERPVPRVLRRGAAGQLRDERLRGAHGAGACRRRARPTSPS